MPAGSSSSPSGCSWWQVAHDARPWIRKFPSGPLADKWERRKFENKLVNPANRRKYDIIIVGTGLAGSSAAAALGEQGYRVKLFCILDSPRRAHSIAAQGGINAAKNYRNDGDSVYRLFYDTVKGGDYRAREANVYRLAQLSVDIIDQCVATGRAVCARVRRAARQPVVRRRAGLANVLRARPDGPATAARRVSVDAPAGGCRQRDAVPAPRDARPRLVDGQARGIVTRNLITGELERHEGQAVLLCTGGYGTVYYLSTNAVNSNVTAAWRAHKRGALFANPCFTQIHPTCIPVSGDHQSKLTLMSESPPQRRARVGAEEEGRRAPPGSDSRSRARLLPRAPLSELRQSRAARRRVAGGQAAVRRRAFGVGDTGLSVYLDFKDAIERLGIEVIKARYGNLFEMYERITAEDPYKVPMRIYPAIHYTMGGLWVDYNLESTIPGLFVLGEANFSDHGANRLGASALMQGLADGYFIAPYTVANYLAGAKLPKVSTDHDAFKEAASDAQARIDKVLGIKGKRTVRQFHRAARADHVGPRRHGAQRGRPAEALQKIRTLRDEFWQDVTVPGEKNNLNPMLDYAGRVADYMEFGELLTLDALHRNESCGGHFREEFQTPDGEALRDDDHYSYVAAWEFTGVGSEPKLHKEPLMFDEVHPSQRSYK